MYEARMAAFQGQIQQQQQHPHLSMEHPHLSMEQQAVLMKAQEMMMMAGLHTFPPFTTNLPSTSNVPEQKQIESGDTPKKDTSGGACKDSVRTAKDDEGESTESEKEVKPKTKKGAKGESSKSTKKPISGLAKYVFWISLVVSDFLVSDYWV